MDELISRQAAIDLLKQMRKDGDMVPWEGKNVFARIRELPTIQPELSTNLASLGADCISSQEAISAICNACGKIDCDKMDKCEKLQLSPANISETPNSSDTISRQAAIDALYSVDEYNSRSVKAIKQLPPIQSEIVRCKDCKYWIPYDWMFSEVWRSKNMADYPEDEIGCNWCDMAMKANDFCSRGEKREVTNGN